MQNTLVIGSGRVGLAFTNELATLNFEVLNIGVRAQSELRQVFGELCKFDTIFWCARDAGTPDNETNCKEIFLDLLKHLELSSWKGLFVFYQQLVKYMEIQRFLRIRRNPPQIQLPNTRKENSRPKKRFLEFQ